MKNYYYSPLKCNEIAKEIRSEFAQPIPMYLLTKIAWYLKNTGMSLIDSTNEAFRGKSTKGQQVGQDVLLSRLQGNFTECIRT